MKKEDAFLFFCNICGMPQKITNYVIKHYLLIHDVKGYYCQNCSALNELKDRERLLLLREK